MITVYHRKSEYADFLTAGKFPDEYMLICQVKSDKLEDAFMFTQHGEKSWTDNRDKFRVLPQFNVRSTSVGDIFVNRFKKIYVVGMTGYKLYK